MQNTVFRLNFYQNGDSFLEVMDSNWRLTKGDVRFSLQVDDYTAKLRGQSWGNAITHDFFQENNMLVLIGLLMKGNRLTLYSPNGAQIQSFSLRGSRKAMNTLGACIKSRW